MCVLLNTPSKTYCPHSFVCLLLLSWLASRQGGLILAVAYLVPGISSVARNLRSIVFVTVVKWCALVEKLENRTLLCR